LTGLSANLRCRSETCCTELAEIQDTISAPSHKFVGLYLSNYGMYRQSLKTVKQQYVLQMSSEYDELRSLMTDTVWRLWCTPASFNGFASWLRYCTDVAQRRSTKLCMMLGCLCAGTLYIHTFVGSSPLTEFCQVQYSLCVQVLRSPVLAA